jgi:hypothetical protein
MPATATAALPVAWKPDWEDYRRRATAFWERRGLLVGSWGAPRTAVPHADVPDPGPGRDWEERHVGWQWRIRAEHRRLANSAFPLDALPAAFTCYGPGSLALFLGARPEFKDTVWFHPVTDDLAQLPTLRLDESNPWWRRTVEHLTAQVALADGNYLVGLPDLVENMDILSSLVGGDRLMFDLVERPELVAAKIMEVNQVWLAAMERLVPIVSDHRGGNAFGAFVLWGPGRTAKLQCDAAAMFSPRVFQRMIVPALTEQCRWLDYSLFHLDGTQAIGHLDHLLAIDELDAIEWTPQSGLEAGEHPRWWEMYRRIKAAGKCVQVMVHDPAGIPALLDAIGPEGVYLVNWLADEAAAERVARLVAPYGCR